MIETFKDEMKTLIAILLLIAMPSVVGAERPTPYDRGENVIPWMNIIGTETSTFDGKTYVFVVKSTDGRSTWKLEEKLPVEISEVVSTAKTQLALYTPRPETYLVSAVTLERFFASNHWYFKVEFAQITQIKEPFPRIRIRRLAIPVLLDGTPIKGVLRPSEESTLRDRWYDVTREIDVSMIDGNMYTFLVKSTDTDIQPAWKLTDNQPVWKLEEKPPVEEKLPMELSEVVSIAKTQLSLYTPSPETYLVSAVTVERFFASKRWHFKVGFTQIKGPNPGVYQKLTIPILLDGTPIEGMLVPKLSK